jgi:hypothetical protein
MTKEQAKKLFYWIRMGRGTYMGITNHQAWKMFTSALVLSDCVDQHVVESWVNPFKANAKPRPIYDV